MSSNRNYILNAPFFDAILAAMFTVTFCVGGGLVSEGNPFVSTSAKAGEKSRESTMPAPRHPEIAVLEEYEMARRRGTAEALELFISRHPDSDLAVIARTELQKIKR
jgi:hypothetical protein